MKCIVKALNETLYKPRTKWWGFRKDGRQFLCRYHHIMCVFEKGLPIHTFYETRTDKTGVMFAIRYMNECSKICAGGNSANTR